ncbi:hypothetical protein acsn021_04000 [Anaerocolumna cellulosilytica]|uniref:Uncharacterized protein n=1 Tax=Anaerocolumna cellulosilytica TaxID=433286 RepID=A0A6S6R0R8_9FIRM|nr:hypothetical protein [Anaerocolumna cellulosilytica]MBB5197388.1 hypothetical protein [Anaerocolumna cellulosilytica]BCJ92831.1 hypothetical protein acsn021_04000 [Anaerocolumna cellulosilytica]
MKKELKSKIESVCGAVNQIFDNKTAKKLILDFATAVAEAPNEELAQEVVDMVINSVNQVLDKSKPILKIMPGRLHMSEEVLKYATDQEVLQLQEICKNINERVKGTTNA